MSNIVDLGGFTKGRVPPEHMGPNTNWDNLEDVLIIGWTKDDMFYIASSSAQTKDILEIIEVAKKELMERY